MKVIFSLILCLAIWCSTCTEAYSCAHVASPVPHCACPQVLPFGLSLNDQEICSSCHLHKCQGHPTSNPIIGNAILNINADCNFAVVVCCMLVTSITTSSRVFAQQANPPPATILSWQHSKIYLQNHSLLI